MPKISEFYGIAIRMYVDDHAPPHFHAIYGDFEAQIAINSGDVIQGRLPATALRLVREWTKRKRAALEENRRRRSMEFRWSESMGSILNKVLQVAVVGRFGLAVRFQDGASGVHDCSDLVRRDGAVMIPLRDPSYFAEVRLEHGAPTWPNGYDMCPDWLR